MTRCSIRHSFRTLMGVALLWLFITLKIPKEAEDDENVKSRHDSEINPSPTDDWKIFRYLEKIQQRKKTLLTVGLTAVSRYNGADLLHTLDSLYQSSSISEQKHLTVLVHLADSDFTWLREIVMRISSRYYAQILAGNLQLIHVPDDVYPTMDSENETYYGQLSKQNVDHAFLLNFASKLSTYFLLIEDNVFCSPNFVTQIHSKVTAMKFNPWVILEFSNMGILGKLFHSKDLPLLAHFLLLFHKTQPLDKLITRFQRLMVQQRPLLYKPFLFFHRVSHPTSENKDTVAEKNNPYGPDILPGAVFTDMKVSDAHFPWEAYTLDESFFWTYNVTSGNHLTVILTRPANLSRVQVRTGSMVEGKYILAKGQVELGYHPEGVPPHCSTFALLGRFVQGQMDLEIFQKHMRYQVSCVRLTVNADQIGGLMIRHIYLWKEKAQTECC